MPQCPACGGELEIGGPAWLGPLYEEQFLGRMVDACNALDPFPKKSETLRLLALMQQELRGPILGIHIAKLCDKLDVSGPPFSAIQAELDRQGYIHFRTHFDPLILKTNAPVAVMEDILRRLNAQK